MWQHEGESGLLERGVHEAVVPGGCLHSRDSPGLHHEQVQERKSLQCENTPDHVVKELLNLNFSNIFISLYTNVKFDHPLDPEILEACHPAVLKPL